MVYCPFLLVNCNREYFVRINNFKLVPFQFFEKKISYLITQVFNLNGQSLLLMLVGNKLRFWLCSYVLLCRDCLDTIFTHV